MKDHKLEILHMSYQEHFKRAKELATYLPIDHPKRLQVEKEANKIIQEIQNLEEDGNERSYNNRST